MDHSKRFWTLVQCIAILSLASAITANGQLATTPLIFNVTTTNVTATTTTITWSTTKRADSQVAYFIGSAKPKWTPCCSPSNTTSHSVTLTGLTPNTEYNFFVESTPTGSSTSIDSTTSTFQTGAAFSISNVAATNITETTAIITWTTTQKADSQVAYFIGSAKPTWTPCCSPSKTTAHSVTLTGLMPNAVYNFFVESMPTGGSKPIDSASSTFQTPSAKGLENLGAGSTPYAVVDSNGVIDITWTATNGVMFAKSKDNGVTFSTPKLVASSPAGAQSIQVDAKNNIFILVGYNPASMLNGNTAALARSTNGGKTFGTVIVKQNIFASLLLVQPSGIVDFAYTTSGDGIDPDDAVRETYSTDGGQTFVNDQLLWSTAGGNDVLVLRGAIGPQGQVYLTWDEQVDFDTAVYFIASLDGVNFLPYQEVGGNLVMNTEIFNDDPTLVLDAAGNVNIAWVNADSKAYFTRSTDQGQTFATPVSLPGSPGETENALPFVVRPDGEIDFVFTVAPSSSANPAPSQVFFTRSLDHGATWSTPVNLSPPNPVQSFAGAQDPQLAVDTSGKITVAWEDDSNGKFSGDNDIYIRTSPDGVTFSSPMDVSNTTDQIEINPTILETPNGMRYMTWYDMNGQQTNPVLSVFFYAGQ